jgi:hypothetical protein
MISRLERVKKGLSRILVVALLFGMESRDKIYDLLSRAVHDTILTLDQNNNVKVVYESPAGNNIVVQICVLVFLMLLFSIGENAIHLSFEKFRSLRRLAMGEYDIEGIWLDVVISSDKVVGGGFVVITFKKGMYVLEGEDFDKTGKFVGNFETTLSRYDEDELDYKYRIMKRDNGEKTGHGIYRFHRAGSRKVWNYDGFFLEDQQSGRYYTYGERLKYYVKDRKEYDRLKKPENRPGLVVKFMNEKKGRFSVETDRGGKIVSIVSDSGPRCEQEQPSNSPRAKEARADM